MTSTSSERWQAEVDARLARLELRADEVELADAGLGAHSGATATGKQDYPDLESWVREYFYVTFQRPLGGESRWCSQWPEHREAVVRLDALWCSWKSLRRDQELGLSTWFHNFLDPQLNIILSARGPFAQCSPDRHEAPSGHTKRRPSDG